MISITSVSCYSIVLVALGRIRTSSVLDDTFSSLASRYRVLNITVCNARVR